jgi:mannose-6-phosphate isomerase-like protein (cupin superfamily)
MRSVLILCAVAVTLVPNRSFAQAQPAPGKPAEPPSAPAQRQPRRAATVPLAVEVTDRAGGPIADVQVALAGPVDRSGATGANGDVAFRGLRAGTYRLRFERDGFTTLEREVVVSARQPVTVSVALTPTPAEKSEPPPAPAPAPAPQTPAPIVKAEPRVLSIPDFLDRNLVRSEPQKLSLIGCAQGGTTRLLQVRDPLEAQLHDDEDEILYVVAGDGTVKLPNQEAKVSAGYYALIPRGAAHSIRRQGRNPLILLSILAGPPCTEGTR